MTLPVVLLTDGEQRATLALARSLGRAGYRVVVTSGGGRSLAGASRFCRREFAVGDALGDPSAFSARVAAAANEVNAGLVIPVSEAALLALLDSPLAARGLIPFPPLEQVRAICDKARVLAVAPEAGIAVPDQVMLQQATDLSDRVLAGLHFPLVIKPSRSVSAGETGRVKLTVMHAASPEELAAALRRVPPGGYPVLLQQRIVGPGIGVFLLLWNGELVAQFSHRRLREKPPSGGVSVYRESIAPDPGLVRRSRALLERFGWRGVAMVEYKVDAATGTPYLMEINGRFWGSLQLAIDSGVDFPLLLARAFAGERPDPVLAYRAGVRSRWWWGDVDHLGAMLKRGPARLGLPPGAPGRLRTALDFLKLWRPGDRNEILRWNDPAPFVRETALWLTGR